MDTTTRQPVRARIGGSFAPPITPELLDEYRERASKASSEVRDVMEKLCDMVEAYLDRPSSKKNGTPHPLGIKGLSIVALEEDTIEELDPLVPYPYECDAYQGLFESLPIGVRTTERFEESDEFADGQVRLKQVSAVDDVDAKELRDAAFHLLWYAKELTLDRVPATTDTLPRSMVKATSDSQESKKKKKK